MCHPVPIFSPLWFRYRLMDIRGRGVYAHHANRCNCIFIHIPKSAGTSVARALFDAQSRHVRYLEYEKANPWKFRRYFKFTFVRNPWDRLVSTFFFLKSGGLNPLDAAFAEQYLSHYCDFSDFVMQGLNSDEVQHWVHFRPQSWFVCDPGGNLKVDFVGHFETLSEDFGYVARRLGLDRALPRSNASNHQHYRTYYDEKTWSVVAKTYQSDIELFGYESCRLQPYG